MRFNYRTLFFTFTIQLNFETINAFGHSQKKKMSDKNPEKGEIKWWQQKIFLFDWKKKRKQIYIKKDI